jgi:hypothetical protein
MATPGAKEFHEVPLSREYFHTGLADDEVARIVIFPLSRLQVASSFETYADEISLTVTEKLHVSVMGLPDKGIYVAV